MGHVIGTLAVFITAVFSALFAFATSPEAQSQTVTASPTHATVSVSGADLGEFRDGSGADNHAMKITGTDKYTVVTLKHGIVSDSSLNEWLHGMTAKAVVIGIQSAGKPPVTYHLSDCKPVKYEGPTLGHSKGNDVAIEELVLSCERITLVK